MADHVAETYLSHLPANLRTRWAEHPELAGALRALVDRGRAAWPEFELAADVVVGYLAAHDPTASTAVDALARVDAAELYLLCGCSHGNEQAIAAFTRDYLVVVDRTLARMGIPPETIADIRQSISQRLLVAGPDRGPRMDDYVGRGDMRGLLRVAARREAIDLLRQGRHMHDLNDQLLQLPGSLPDPELECIKQQQRSAVREALSAALAGLEPRERTLLRLQLLERLTVQQIATCYNVHRTTATRWLATARSNVLTATQAALTDSLSGSDFSGVVDLVASRLELSLERLLATTERSQLERAD